jgi:hypothetical protein
MKISQLEEAMRLRSEFRSLRKMQAAASGYPRFDGFLTINGEDVVLPHAEIDRILQDYEHRLSDKASELDIEIDE